MYPTYRNEDIRVVAAYPSLILESGYVECFAGVRQVPIVLLKYFVEACEVQIDILLKLKEMLSNLLHPLFEEHELLAVYNRVFDVIQKLARHLDLQYCTGLR